MTKKRSRSLFVIFAIILVVCLIACFVNFTYPFTIGGNYYNYSSFASNIRLGEDIGESVRIVYRAELPENESQSNYENLRKSTMNSLQEIVTSEGYKDVTIAEYGDDGIVIQVGNLLSKDDETSILNLIGNPKAITFSTTSGGANPFATGKHISSVYATQYRPQGSGEVSYIVVVQFKDEYITAIEEASNDKTVYVYLGENLFGSLSYSGSSISNGVIYLQSSNINSLVDAESVANQIKTGTLDLELTQVESGLVTPTYGAAINIGNVANDNATAKTSVFVWLSLFIFALAIFVFLIVKYRHAGWLAVFALLFYIAIGLFLIQSIPASHVNFAGLFAMMLNLIFVTDSIVKIFETAKKYYLEDTKFHIAFKTALKDSWKKVLISNVIALVVGFICIFIPTASIHAFGWITFTLSFVSAFISLVLMRLFINMYLALNNTNGKKCNFHKGGKNA